VGHGRNRTNPDEAMHRVKCMASPAPCEVRGKGVLWIFPVQEDRLKAYVAITFDNCFVVRDLKVISGNNGLFVAMPSKKRKDGTYRDTAHPLNNETRQMIESKVLEEYNKEIQKNK